MNMLLGEDRLWSASILPHEAFLLASFPKLYKVKLRENRERSCISREQEELDGNCHPRCRSPIDRRTDSSAQTVLTNEDKAERSDLLAFTLFMLRAKKDEEVRVYRFTDRGLYGRLNTAKRKEMGRRGFEIRQQCVRQE
jgi:hypothetical protein